MIGSPLENTSEDDCIQNPLRLRFRCPSLFLIRAEIYWIRLPPSRLSSISKIGCTWQRYFYLTGVFVRRYLILFTSLWGGLSSDNICGWKFDSGMISTFRRSIEWQQGLCWRVSLVLDGWRGFLDVFSIMIGSTSWRHLMKFHEISIIYFGGIMYLH